MESFGIRASPLTRCLSSASRSRSKGETEVGGEKRQRQRRSGNGIRTDEGTLSVAPSLLISEQVVLHTSQPVRLVGRRLVQTCPSVCTAASPTTLEAEVSFLIITT